MRLLESDQKPLHGPRQVLWRRSRLAGIHVDQNESVEVGGEPLGPSARAHCVPGRGRVAGGRDPAPRNHVGPDQLLCAARRRIPRRADEVRRGLGHVRQRRRQPSLPGQDGKVRRLD